MSKRRSVVRGLLGFVLLAAIAAGVAAAPQSGSPPTKSFVYKKTKQADLEMQAIFARERTWCQPSPLVCPERVRAMKAQGRLTPQKRGEYRAALTRVRAIEARLREARSEGERQLHRIVRWVLAQWVGENRALLEQPPTTSK